MTHYVNPDTPFIRARGVTRDGERYLLLVLPPATRDDAIRENVIAPQYVSTRRTHGGGRVPYARVIQCEDNR